ncbi:MAG: FAD-binding protein [Chloroflexi bacterium]|nr:FAD-binding protein [Chloroflexota bacterium]
MNQAQLIEALGALVGPQHVLHSPEDLYLYGYDASLDRGAPQAVALPGSAEEAAAVMRLAHGENLPVTPRGAGTNLSGGSVAAAGGIVLALSRLNRILEIDLPNRCALVEPGVFNLTLQKAVAPHGYLFAPDPASQKVSTLGGNVGENSGGPHCLKYGVTLNHVLGMELVLPDGETVFVGGKAPDRPGYDLTGLLVGSEGTLGIATKILVRLTPQPEGVRTLLALFDDLGSAGRTVSAVIAAGIIPATLEMMDHTVIQAVERATHAGLPLDVAALLIAEVDGLQDELDEQAAQITAICQQQGAREVKAAHSQAERDALWAGRRGAFGALGQLAPSYLVLDGTVPRTRLPEALERVAEVGRRYGLAIGDVFHAGDGNLHPLILFDPQEPGILEKVRAAGAEILHACADLGGTITGEHGIGLEKIEAMPLIFSPADLEAMWAVKRALDPAGVANPGKVLPPRPPQQEVAA